MTKKQTTEIFSAMMLAWPNAEMFKGGIQKLAPTIGLWATCLPDVDFWTAQRAVVKLCRECKFPPSIAEFREKADKVLEEIDFEARAAFQDIRNAELYHGTIDEFYKRLPTESRTKATIDAMGGLSRLYRPIGDGLAWNIYEFENTYKALLRDEPIPVISAHRSLAGPSKPRKEGK